MKAWWNNGVKTITTHTFAENKSFGLAYPVKHRSRFIFAIASAFPVLEQLPIWTKPSAWIRISKEITSTAGW
jgi:hypothetical protein